MSLSNHILSEINEIRRVSSNTTKESILLRNKDSVTFRKVLQYTYNPFVRFHIRKIPAEVVGQGIQELNHDTWVLLNKLAMRKLTGIAARESLFEHIEALTPSAAMIVKCIIKKDFKAGIAIKTINKALPGLIPTFDCQLVEEWDESRITYPILISPKLDGTRGEKRGSGLYTRRGHQITGVDHILRYLDSISPNMTVSGELFIPGMPFRRSDGIIRSNKPNKLNVRFALFDVPNLESVILDERIIHLSKTFYPLESRPLPPVCYIPHMLARSADEVDRMYNYWRSRGYEGLVGKDPNSFPQPGKSYAWMRKVNTISAEYRVIDIYESEEKPGYMGGVVIDGGIRVGSGFLDSERTAYLKNPSLIVGKMVTIVAKERTAAGSLRQPIFKSIRWDI